jgi:tetratricopeptide (TPR) repeat protein
MEEYPLSIADRICGELEDKNRVLSEYVKDREEIGDKEGVIQVRIHQLALCKVLVNVHNRSPFILVQAHTNLGESYLSKEYYEQALDHLTSALKLNGNLFNSVQDAKPFHTHILTLLGKCYMEAGGVEDALGLLDKALKMNKSLLGDDNISHAPILSCLAKVYVKQKEYTKALDSMTSVWELYEAHFGMKHESMIEVYSEMADIYHQQNDINNSIDVLKRKMNLMMELDIQTDNVAETAEKLASWLQENTNYPEALDYLRNAEKIYEYNHGQINKKTAKVKRHICMLLLKAGEYEEALQECLELEEIDKSLHGKSTQQYAKNLKVIGTILMILNRYSQAYEYFNKAYEIYAKLKNKKAVKEIKEKLETIKKNLKENPEGRPQETDKDSSKSQ